LFLTFQRAGDGVSPVKWIHPKFSLELLAENVKVGHTGVFTVKRKSVSVNLYCVNPYMYE